MSRNKNNTKSVTGRGDALSPEALKLIIGGARIDDKHNITPEVAIGMTLGAAGHDLTGIYTAPLPASPGTPDLALTHSNIHLGEQGAFQIKLSLEKLTDGQVTKFDIAASGVKGKPDTVKIAVLDHGAKTNVELTAAEVASHARTGNPLFTGIGDLLKKIDGSDPKQSGDYLKALEKEIRGTFKQKASYSNTSVDPLYSKSVTTLVSTQGTDGKVSEHWETKVNSSALDKAAKLQAETDKANAAEQAAQQTAAKAAQKVAVAGSQQAVKNVVDAGRAVPIADAAADKAAATKTAADGAHRAAVENEKLAQQNYQQAAKSHAYADATGAKHAQQMKAAADKAADAYTAAKKVSSDTAKAAVKANTDATKAGQNLAATKTAVQASKAALDTATTVAKAAHKDVQDGKPRGRSNSVPGQPAGGNDAPNDGDTRPRSKSTAGQIDTNPAKLAEKAKVKKSVIEKTTNAITKTGSKLLKEKGWSAGATALGSLNETLAQNLAKQNGNFHKTESENVLAGGIEKTVTKTGDKTIHDTTVAQVKTESGTMSYSSELGKGASAQWAIRAEAGTEKSVTTDLGDGRSKTTTDKAYAGVAFENEAKATLTKTSASASASSVVTAHAEISHTETTDYGGVKVTNTAKLSADAQATAKAGVTLGFDGVKAEAKASVEASISASTSKQVTIGDVDIKGELKVLAKAKAEAKADMQVSFNPASKDGLKVKGGVSLEASAGVGLEGTTGVKGKSGNGADVGGGVYAGKIGIKTDGNVGFKDGKVSLELNVGASLGIGANINIKVDSNIGKSYSDAYNDIKNGDFTDQALGTIKIVSGLVPNLIIGLFN